ncbi:MAG: histidine kinase, partial [Saprospiraceae bacterium]|nr:histidine kinase [Saprospiraceae bacterium]
MDNNCRTDYLGFDDRIYRLIGIPIVGFSMPFLFFGHTIHEPVSVLWIPWMISTIMSVLYWEGSTQFLIFWRKRMPHIEETGKRIMYQIGTVVVYSILVESLVGFIFSCIPSTANEAHPISGLAGTYLLVFLVLSVYEAIFLYVQWKKALLEKELVKQEHIRSQLEGLRNQVNPHFLFNSLNTLMSIVADDQQLAIRYVQKLSKVFRYVLENRDEQLIRLETELDFIDNYVFLQKERFQENLQVKIDIKEQDKNSFIVPLSLQILFENAIKHNIISKKNPLTIEVFTNEDGKLVVRNNLQVKNNVMPGTKVGLENIKKRYAF